MRIGHGYDMHAHTTARGLWLCGVHLPEAPAVAAHSDGDVALHALIDALLGALAAGDIGQWFPADAGNRDRSSAQMLGAVLRETAACGYAVCHVDITVLSQRVRIAPLRAQLRARLAELLGVGAECVSVKATSTDGLGAVGRGEGIAAHAAVLLQPRP